MPPGSLTRARWLLLVLAALQRVVFRAESVRLPFMEAPMFDSAVYLHQSESILAGHFDDPTLVAFGPAYGWFLAAFGEHAIEAQLVLGWLTCVLVERLGARAGEAAGLAALALWVGYSVPIFYETKIMSEPLGLFLITLAVWSYLHREADEGRPRRALVAGAILGLAVLTRANLLFSLPVFVGAACLRRGVEGRRERAWRAGALTIGLAAVLVANGAWNVAHFGRFIPVILTSRTASRASESAEWTGSLAVFGRDDRPPSAWDVVEQARETLSRPPDEAMGPSIDLAGWVASAPAKLARTFSDVETTFDYGYYGERTELPSLAWQPVSFGTLLLLGALGMAELVRRRRWSELAAHLPLIVGAVVVTTLFHPSTRYRLSMAIPLVSLSAHAVAALIALEPERRRRLSAATLTLVCALLAFRHLTHALASPAMWHLRVAEGEAGRFDVDAARARIARAMTYDDPAAVERLEQLRALGALPPPPP